VTAGRAETLALAIAFLQVELADVEEAIRAVRRRGRHKCRGGRTRPRTRRRRITPNEDFD
jgi:hypothetical protein